MHSVPHSGSQQWSVYVTCELLSLTGIAVHKPTRAFTTVIALSVTFVQHRMNTHQCWYLVLLAWWWWTLNNPNDNAVLMQQLCDTNNSVTHLNCVTIIMQHKRTIIRQK